MDRALSQRVVVVGAAVLLAIAGLSRTRHEAYPDPVQPRVEIITQSLGLSAEEVEKIATIPLELGLAGIRDPGGDADNLSILDSQTLNYISPGTATSTGTASRLSIA